MLESLFNQVANHAGTFTKIRLQDRCFFCKICEIYKSTYFEEHLLTDASINER